MLIDGGADLNFTDGRGCTPLRGACEKGHEAVVRMLIDGGADLNVADRDGLTPLHAACRVTVTDGQRASPEIIPELILNGADTQARDSEGCLPVEYLRAEDRRSRAMYEEAVEEMEYAALRPVLK
jgi:ankyrin repeat protein